MPTNQEHDIRMTKTEYILIILIILILGLIIFAATKKERIQVVSVDPIIDTLSIDTLKVDTIIIK